MEHTLTAGAVLGDRPRPEKNYLNAETGIWNAVLTATRYITPMRLWSTVDIQLQMPVSALR